MDQGLWLLRVLLMSGGSALASRGIGDATLWEAITGGVVALAGAGWSYHARRNLTAP